MATLEALRRTIDSTRELQSVVRTMKALAAVSIRQYERAAAALGEYGDTIDRGLQVLLRGRPALTEVAPARPGAAVGAVVFGSDYGMVGQFNEQVAAYAADALAGLPAALAACRIIAVGERGAARLEDVGARVERRFEVPGSAGGIGALVQDVLLALEGWREQADVGRLLLFYNQTRAGAACHPAHIELLPLDAAWLRELAARPWPSRMLPTHTLGWEELFAALIRQHLFVAIYRACAESLAGENASRLAAMQRTEQYIDDRLDELDRAFQQQRQSAITAELLDIVAGVEALAGES